MPTATPQPSDRRKFLTKLASGSAAVAAGGIAVNFMSSTAQAEVFAPITPSASGAESDEWLDKITGKHRQFFDGVTVNDGFSLGFALNFLNSNNEASKIPDSALTAVVGLRHFAAPLAFSDVIWAKYKVGEFLKLADPGTKQPLARNMYFRAHAGELMLPDMSIDKLQARGVLFTVCNVALTVLSSLTAQSAGVTPEVAKQEWTAGLIPGMYIVPSGVWAVNRAQEKGCTYCAAG
jgi:intracellular sulfur oxidation DsrE/DsrF family protein